MLKDQCLLLFVLYFVVLFGLHMWYGLTMAHHLFRRPSPLYSKNHMINNASSRSMCISYFLVPLNQSV